MSLTLQRALEIFELPDTFDLDLLALHQGYRAAMLTQHPDHLIFASRALREASETETAELNRAYQRLRSPLLRAAWFLERVGILSAGKETLSSEGWRHIFEWHERLEREDRALLQQQWHQQKLEIIAQLSSEFQRENHEAALKSYHLLLAYEKIGQRFKGSTW